MENSGNWGGEMQFDWTLWRMRLECVVVTLFLLDTIWKLCWNLKIAVGIEMKR